MELSPLVLPLQDLTHFAQAAFDRAQEGLMEVFSKLHAFENSLKLLWRRGIDLGDVKDTVREGLHGDLKVLSF